VVDLLRHFSQEFDVNGEITRYTCLLHKSCVEGNFGVVKNLIKFGADKDKIDGDGNTGLCLSLRENHT